MMNTSSCPSGRFLWVRFGALGDVLQALAQAYLVKKHFPEVKMSFLTTPKYVDIVKSQPYIDDVLCGEKKSMSALLATAATLRERKFDWVGSTFKGSRMAWLSSLAKIPNRLGCSNYFQFLNTGNVYEWAEAHGFSLHDRSDPCIFATAENLQKAEQQLSKFIGARKLFAVIGASSESKMWPLANWTELLRALTSDGWKIVINGYGARETDFANRIIDEIGDENSLSLVGKLNFTQMAAVVRKCDATIGNDTGPLHLSALSGVPTLGIFDYIPPIEVGYWMPCFSSIISSDKPLQTFYAKKHSQSVLGEISAEHVREKFNALIEAQGIRTEP